MKIGINITPLITAHKDRGIGRYTAKLVEYLELNQDIEVIKFTDIRKLGKVDLVHYPWFDFYFHTLPIFKKYPTVVTIHDVIPLIFLKYYPVGISGSFNFMLQKIALKKSNFIITDSEASEKDISKYLGIDRKMITSIPLASSKEFGKDSKLAEKEIIKKYNLHNFLLYVGDCNYVKNIPFLIEGFYRLLQKSVLPNIKLVLVGEIFLKPNNELIHPELESLRRVNELISKYSLERVVIRMGNIKDEELQALYKLATVYVQPSLYEGFGLPVLEALVAGTPVVSSNGGGLPETGGEAVIYFNPTDIEDFLSSVQKVLLDTKLRSRMIEMGKKQALKFSWEKAVNQTIEVYKRVLLKNV